MMEIGKKRQMTDISNGYTVTADLYLASLGACDLLACLVSRLMTAIFFFYGRFLNE